MAAARPPRLWKAEAALGIPPRDTWRHKFARAPVLCKPLELSEVETEAAMKARIFALESIRLTQRPHGNVLRLAFFHARDFMQLF